MPTTSTLPTLNLIGPGRIGQTLARLWCDADLLRINAIIGRTAPQSAVARDFIGSGRLATWQTLTPAPFILLAVPDDALAEVAHRLAVQQILRAGDIVFHCSGAQASNVLQALHAQEVLIASIHPLKSFAGPEQSITDFAGTWCASEGDAAALAQLLPLFEAIGARHFQIKAEQKLLYHAGAVLACNHLVALLDAALLCMEQAGIPRSAAWPALRLLIDGTLRNIDVLGTQRALTGPVARGDTQLVQQEIVATQAAGAAVSDSYRALSRLAEYLLQRKS